MYPNPHTPPDMAEESETKKTKEQEDNNDVEAQIQTAMSSRVPYFKEQSE